MYNGKTWRRLASDGPVSYDDVRAKNLVMVWTCCEDLSESLPGRDPPVSADLRWQPNENEASQKNSKNAENLLAIFFAKNCCCLAFHVITQLVDCLQLADQFAVQLGCCLIGRPVKRKCSKLPLVVVYNPHYRSALQFLKGLRRSGRGCMKGISFSSKVKYC